MNMSDRIKQRRLEMNFTQEELASSLGLQKSAIAKYENGRVENVKRSTIELMSTILDCKPSYLMGWDEPLSISIGSLSESESELIEGYRQLNDEGRSHIDLQMDLVLSKDYFKKRDSIKESKKKA